MKKHIVFLVISIALFTLVACPDSDTRLPETEKAEFPFKIVYEFNGKTETIEDTIICEFDELTPYNITPGYFRTWNTYLKSGDKRRTFTIFEDENKESIFNEGRINLRARVYINYGEPEYYMGDPKSQNMTQSAPSINYMENYMESAKVEKFYSKKLTAFEAEEYFGIKIITFEFSEPIENAFK